MVSASVGTHRPLFFRLLPVRTGRFRRAGICVLLRLDFHLPRDPHLKQGPPHYSAKEAGRAAPTWLDLRRGGGLDGGTERDRGTVDGGRGKEGGQAEEPEPEDLGFLLLEHMVRVLQPSKCRQSCLNFTCPMPEA